MNKRIAHKRLTRITRKGTCADLRSSLCGLLWPLTLGVFTRYKHKNSPVPMGHTQIANKTTQRKNKTKYPGTGSCSSRGFSLSLLKYYFLPNKIHGRPDWKRHRGKSMRVKEEQDWGRERERMGSLLTPSAYIKLSIWQRNQMLRRENWQVFQDRKNYLQRFANEKSKPEYPVLNARPCDWTMIWRPVFIIVIVWKTTRVFRYA